MNMIKIDLKSDEDAFVISSLRKANFKYFISPPLSFS